MSDTSRPVMVVGLMVALATIMASAVMNMIQDTNLIARYFEEETDAFLSHNKDPVGDALKPFIFWLLNTTILCSFQRGM